MSRFNKYNIARRKETIPILCKCPKCHKMHIENYEHRPSEEVPRRYCDKHEHLRNDSGEGSGYTKTERQEATA